jgi:hypothetical protein
VKSPLSSARFLILITLPLAAALAQKPMILTESAATLGQHHYEAGLAFEYLTKTLAPSSESPQSLVRIFVIALHSGIARNVDVNMDWRGGLIGYRADGTSVSDWGDLTVSTKFTFLPERGARPALGLRTSIKLPNTKYRPGQLGSNEMDYYTHILVSRRWRTVEARMNLGFGILGDPRALGNQDDVYTLALALVWRMSEGARGFAEVAGMTGYQDNDQKVVLRSGFGAMILGIEWNFFGSVRLIGNHRDFATAFELSESWGIGLMVRKEFVWDIFGVDEGKTGTESEP